MATKLDRIDRKILNLLQEDCTISVSDISAKVALSSTPCWRRIQRMEKEGIISKRVALLNPKKNKCRCHRFCRNQDKRAQ